MRGENKLRKIEDFYVEEMRRLAAGIAEKAIITIEGEDYEYPIVKTVIRDGFFKHYIEVEFDPSGNIEKSILVNENGIPLYTDNTLIEKGRNGWQISFKTFLLVSEDEPPETPIV